MKKFSLTMMFVFVFLLVACSGTHTVSITYVTNGGNMISQTQVNSDSPQWNPTIPQRHGYQFVNWYIDETLTELYTPLALTTNKQLTLYAKWLANEQDTHVIVTFITVGGTYIPNQMIEKNGLAVRPDDPVLTNFVFVRWVYYDMEEAMDLPFDFSQPVSESIHLYAEYDPA